MKIGPNINTPSLSGRYTLYSTTKRITMHKQACMLVTGEVKLYNLKLYLKNGIQYAKTVGSTPNRHFIRKGKIWEQILL